MNLLRLAQTAILTVTVASVTLLASRSLVLAAQNQAAPPATPQTPPPGPPGNPPPMHEMPAPTNLKVLPKNTTGAQLHEIMHQWAGELGTTCKTCHVPDPKNLGPDGKPRLNYADDSKEEKRTARKMYKMMGDINANYISKIDSSGMPVTCGTCHRGHIGPEPYIPSPQALHAH